MRILTKFCCGMFIFMIVAAMVATVQAEDVSLKILAPWEAAGRVFKVGPNATSLNITC